MFSGEDRCPVVLVGDVSSAMGQQGRTEVISSALHRFKHEAALDAIADLRLDVALIAFSDDAVFYSEFAPSRELAIPDLKAGGGCAIGKAMDLALAVIDRHKATKADAQGWYRP